MRNGADDAAFTHRDCVCWGGDSWQKHPMRERSVSAGKAEDEPGKAQGREGGVVGADEYVRNAIVIVLCVVAIVAAWNQGVPK